jgi:hypothetical protein
MKRELSPDETKRPVEAKKTWEAPKIVMEHSLVVRAQEPDNSDPTKPKDPFLGALVAPGGS